MAQGKTLGRLACDRGIPVPEARGEAKVGWRDSVFRRAIVRSAPTERIFLFSHPTQGFVRRGGLHPGLFSLAPCGSRINAPFMHVQVRRRWKLKDQPLVALDASNALAVKVLKQRNR